VVERKSKSDIPTEQNVMDVAETYFIHSLKNIIIFTVIILHHSAFNWLGCWSKHSSVCCFYAGVLSARFMVFNNKWSI